MAGLLGIKSVSLHPVGGHVFWTVLVLAAAVAFSVWAYKTTLPEVTRRSRGWLIALRCLVFALLALILLQPVLGVVAPHKTRPSLPILIDVSASMDTPLGGADTGAATTAAGSRDKVSEESASGSVGQVTKGEGSESGAGSTSGNPAANADAANTRFDAELQVLRALRQELGDSYRVPVYPFALDVSGPEPGNPSSLPDTAAGRYATAMGEALEEIVLRREAESAVGVIVVSDGAVNRGEDPLRAVRSIEVPVYTVVIGDTFGVPDCQVAEIRVNPTAYVDAEVPVRAVIKSQGYEGRTALVQLKDGEQVLDSREIALAGAGFEQEVDLSFVPRVAGERFLTLSLEHMDGEQTYENNTRDAAITVVQQKLEILYLEGRVSWEFTFLKRALDEDRNLRTHYLLALDGRTIRPLDPETGPFPSRPEDLSGYSLVIVGDCDPSMLSMAQWSALVEYVRRGGGLLVLAGRSDRGLSRFASTPLEELMPVALAPGQASRRLGSFGVHLTAAGREHPVTKVDVDAAVSDSLWNELPPLLEVYLVGQPRSRSQVLVAARDDSRALPVIAVRNFDEGKVMAVNSSSLWRWGFLSEGVLGSRTLYDRLWSNSIRWLTRSEDEGVRVFAENGVYPSGEMVRIGASVTGEGYRPVTGASVEVELADSEGRGVARSLTLADSDVPGHYEGGVKALPPGEYELTGDASVGGSRLGSSSARFRVDSAGLEFSDLRARGDLMRALAAASGGKSYSIRDFVSLPNDVGKAKLEFARTVELNAWNHPAVFVALLILLAVEWVWRRRLGMV
jgi:uncharacterized membrane protein